MILPSRNEPDAADIPEELRGLGWTPDPAHRDLIAAPDADMPALSALEINAVAGETPAGEELTAYFGFPTGVLTRDEQAQLRTLLGRVVEQGTGHTLYADHVDP